MPTKTAAGLESSPVVPEPLGGMMAVPETKKPASKLPRVLRYHDDDDISKAFANVHRLLSSTGPSGKTSLEIPEPALLETLLHWPAVSVSLHDKSSPVGGLREKALYRAWENMWRENNLSVSDKGRELVVVGNS